MPAPPGARAGRTARCGRTSPRMTSRWIISSNRCITVCMRTLTALALAVVLALGLIPAPAHAQAWYPVDWDYELGNTIGFAFPDTPPPGADNWACQPSTAHPLPVI